MNNYLKINEGFITNSKMNSFKFCPTLFDLKYNQKIVPESRSDALIFGSAFDQFIQDDKKIMDEKYNVVKIRFDPKKKIEKIGCTINEIKKEIKEIEKIKELKKGDIKKIETRNLKLQKLKEEKNMYQKTTEKEQLTETQADKLVNCLNEFHRQPLFDFDSERTQISVEINYKGHKLRGTMDEFYEDRKLISDIKTAASIDGLDRKWIDGQTALEKYKNQLSFYQFLVQIKYDILCDGRLQVVTKEDPARSSFYVADKLSLLDNRQHILNTLENMMSTIELGIYSSSDDREKCLKCPAYGVCNYAKQKEYILI